MSAFSGCQARVLLISFGSTRRPDWILPIQVSANSQRVRSGPSGMLAAPSAPVQPLGLLKEPGQGRQGPACRQLEGDWRVFRTGHRKHNGYEPEASQHCFRSLPGMIESAGSFSSSTIPVSLSECEEKILASAAGICQDRVVLDESFPPRCPPDSVRLTLPM